MYATLNHIENITPTVKTFWFVPDKKVRYVAGQFTELYLPHQADMRGIRRWFTISSSPTERLIGITTRFSATRSSTYKQQLLLMQPGERVHLADPMGDFVLPKDPAIPIVFVAAGMGITPVRSMVKWLLDTRSQRTVKLLYATKSPTELAFSALFRTYPLGLTSLTSAKNEHITTEQILTLLSDLANPYIYISGPEELVESLYKNLKQVGIDPDRLIADYFPGYMRMDT